MDTRNGLVGWSDDQWNRIRQAISEEAHRARVAASFLPTYGPLPPSTQVVPSERVTNGEVDDVFTAPLVEIYREVVLSRQHVNEDDLASALLSFRQAANEVARVEDQIIFNGQHGYSKPTAGPPARAFEKITDAARPYEYKRKSDGGASPTNIFGRVKVKDGVQDYDYLSTYFTTYLLPNLTPSSLDLKRFVDEIQYVRLKATNPGGLGLLPSAEGFQQVRKPGEDVVADIIDAVTQLEAKRHLAPFVCVLGNKAFVTTHTPIGNTGVLPSDRIEPILGSQLLRSSAFDPLQGVVLSLAGDPIDIAVSVDASPQFLNINGQGQYLFRVVERFALRVKDPEAIVRLEFV